MNSIHLINTLAAPFRSCSPPSLFPQCHYPLRSSAVPKRRRFSHSSGFRLASTPTVNSVPVSLLLFGSTVILTLPCSLTLFLLRVALLPSQRGNGTYTVADFMTKKQDLYVVKTTTTVDEGTSTSMLYALLSSEFTLFIYLYLFYYSSGGSGKQQNQWSSGN